MSRWKALVMVIVMRVVVLRTLLYPLSVRMNNRKTQLYIDTKIIQMDFGDHALSTWLLAMVIAAAEVKPAMT